MAKAEQATRGEQAQADASLAEDLRLAVGSFVRCIRIEADTPTTAQAETLGLLERDGPATVAALAQRRSVKHQSMRLVTALLQGDGLVECRADPRDRRSQLVAITEKGRLVLARARAQRASIITDLIRDRLSPADHSLLRAAVELLNRMSARTP